MVLTHQDIGIQQKLFFLDKSSPGNVFWMPDGTYVYNKLKELLRKRYVKRDYQEVITPNIGHSDLWKTSGHWDKYQENMFVFNIKDDEERDQHVYALKGMNCPFHCVMFKHMNPSYRELPIKLADFGALHRNEASGALHGLLRTRRFCQDDAHIFCKPSDLSQQIQDCLGFMAEIYGLFGFEFEMELSTRPEKFIGEIEVWNNAEEILKQELENFGHKWMINPQDGAFYGPKIDIKIKDSLNRYHQCATIQLDFNLPERFELRYHTEDQENPFERPIIVHRAIYGSFGRFIAILCEHLQGKWPFWLSPRQIKIVPISEANFEYANQLYDDLKNKGFRVNTDLTDKHFKKKIKDAEVLHYNHIIVIGNKEQETNSINLRKDGKQQLISFTDYCEQINQENNF